MSKTLSAVACVLLLAGCATAPQHVVRAPDPLLGAWRGEYTSSTPGHSGILHINVNTQAGGEVLMIADEWTQRGSRYPGPPPATTQQPELLGATLERSGSNELVMQVHRYRDQLCGCDVTLVFRGSVKWDAMEGRFSATEDNGHVVFEGSWSARRLLVDADARVDGNHTLADGQDRVEVELGDFGHFDR